MKKYLFFVLLALASGWLGAQNEKRVALIIGNQNYQGGGALTYPLQDAKIIKETLENLNFDVTHAFDAGKTDMERAFIRFRRKAQNANVSLIYYSGHGLQIDGKNYLVPVDANITDKISATDLTINTNNWISKLEAITPNLKIIILDACRDNPYKQYIVANSKTTMKNGLEEIDPPSGTFIAFATSADNVAADNGLYAKTLAAEMKKQQSIFDVFINTRKTIENATSGSQRPMEWSSIRDNFCFTCPQKSGTIVIGYTQYAGTVKLNNKNYGTVSANTSKTLKNIPVGDYTLSIGTQWQKKVTVQDNDVITVNALKPEEPNPFANYTETATGVPFDMVRVKGGTFTMGQPDPDIGCEGCSDDEQPPHEVTISTFSMSKFEVTNAQFAAFIFDYGSDKVKSGEYAGEEMIYEYRWGFASTDPTGFENPAGLINDGYENHPVVYVTWYGANEYCNWLSQKTGKTYRLPTEAEWEYAAGGGANNRTKWAGTNNGTTRGHAPLTDYAWYDKNSYDLGSGHKDYGTHEVGTTKKPNQLGLYDMSGNVWEWCLDWYDEDYYQELVDSDEYKRNKRVLNPLSRNNSSSTRVLRGGSWYDVADYSRVANRDGNNPVYGSVNYGFRVVVEL